jgi:integrase
MSVFVTEKSAPYFWYSFQLQRRRFFGSTRCTSRKEAERFEAIEREKATARLKAENRSRTSLTLDDVAARLWTDQAQYDAEPDATATNIARIVDHFGKATSLVEIDHAAAKKGVAWRRGHRIARRGKRTKEEQEALPLISNATVNRSFIKVLQRIFAFAKDEGATFEGEPKWGELLLAEPVERIRELQDDEADALDASMRGDYGPFFEFARVSGMRLKECVTLRWSEVNFGTRQIVKTGKGGRRVLFPITDSIREMLFPLQGDHGDFVFTYVCACSNIRTGRVRGERYPLSYNGTKSAWQRMRAEAGLNNFRFHDFRHTLGSAVLRETGNLKLAQKALNHADIKSTLRYCHVLDQDVADAIERVATRRRKTAGKNTGKIREAG